jgi:hypothetical protein
LLTVEGGVKKMKIALLICCELDSTLRPTFAARILYHSGLTAGIDITERRDAIAEILPLLKDYKVVVIGDR